MSIAPAPAVVPAHRVEGRLVATLIGDGATFVTRAVDGLDLTHEGIPGSRYHGHIREADARTPWHKRGTPIRNTRQVSAVSVEDLAAIAAAMDLPEIRPEWLGANLVFTDIPHFSFLPRGTLIHAPSGASLRVEDQNAPCRQPGRVIADLFPGREGLELLFPKVAMRLRGLVLSVDRAGRVAPGDAAQARLPEQWIYA